MFFCLKARSKKTYGNTKNSLNTNRKVSRLVWLLEVCILGAYYIGTRISESRAVLQFLTGNRSLISFLTVTASNWRVWMRCCHSSGIIDSRWSLVAIVHIREMFELKKDRRNINMWVYSILIYTVLCFFELPCVFYL